MFIKTLIAGIILFFVAKFILFVLQEIAIKNIEDDEHLPEYPEQRMESEQARALSEKHRNQERMEEWMKKMRTFL